ncbi:MULTISPECIES: DMT family transporter [Maribacter]|uniref:DMT family transporter n=1 Tax=Maribacter flavus TaxID=1658664 RepID=A0ABU7II76_9FLAO|nr:MULTISPECIES: DMT family transporter [Maribacter]MDC6405570.1 DMT family transporter [Maribacter sp. PR66]MEE1972662.1 DMT family transporter [Maribacter flavus]
MNRSHVSHLLEINLAMLFIATSGPLGRFVDLPVPVITGMRGIIAFILLILFCRWRNISLKVKNGDIPLILVTGVLMAAHWLFYFYALQWSNVAIGMLSLFTYPVITAFLEPILLKSKLQRMHLLLGALVLLGIYFLSPNFNLRDSNTLAILMGLVSAVSYALRNIILKLKVEKYQGTTLMVYQTGTIAILMLPALFFTTPKEILGQWEGLLALGVLTTAIGHSLFLMTFKHFSITTVSILSSVQPIYGILIGALFLNEIPKATTLFGGALILSSVVIESFRASKKQQVSSQD